MNIWDFVIIALIIAACVWAVIKIKHGKSCCKDCSSCESCHMCKKEKE